MRALDRQSGLHRFSPWAWLVGACALLLVGGAVVLAVWWALSSETRVATYSVRGTLSAVSLDLAGADADIVGGRSRPVVEVRRTDAFAFGRPATSQRDLAGGVLRLRSRCPETVLGSCSARYRVTVPDNVAVTVRTGSGDVRFTGFRGSARIATVGGDISADGFCGFTLLARAVSGNVRASAACAPERLELRSRSGEVRAVVPPGRYRVDADSDDGRRRVAGVIPTDDAPFQIQALSRTGNVDVEASP